MDTVHKTKIENSNDDRHKSVKLRESCENAGKGNKRRKKKHENKLAPFNVVAGVHRKKKTIRIYIKRQQIQNDNFFTPKRAQKFQKYRDLKKARPNVASRFI